MGIMVYSLLWVVQDLYHQPQWLVRFSLIRIRSTLGCWGTGLQVQSFFLSPDLGYRIEDLLALM